MQNCHSVENSGIEECLNVTVAYIKNNTAGCQWLTPVILAIQEVEIRKTAVQSQPRQIV
jgi:hypothetical protein